MSACLFSCTEWMRKECKNNQKRTGLWRNPGQRRWTWPVLLLKFFICEQSDCVKKPGDTQSFRSAGWIIKEARCKQKSIFQSPTQRRVLKDGKGMLNCSSAQEICGNWIPRMFRKSRSARKFRRFRTQKSNLATSFPYITRLCTTHGESLLDRGNDLWSETDG